jgi:hypothetical protein
MKIDINISVSEKEVKLLKHGGSINLQDMVVNIGKVEIKIGGRKNIGNILLGTNQKIHTLLHLVGLKIENGGGGVIKIIHGEKKEDIGKMVNGYH